MVQLISSERHSEDRVKGLHHVVNLQLLGSWPGSLQPTATVLDFPSARLNLTHLPRVGIVLCSGFLWATMQRCATMYQPVPATPLFPPRQEFGKYRLGLSDQHANRRSSTKVDLITFSKCEARYAQFSKQLRRHHSCTALGCIRSFEGK